MARYLLYDSGCSVCAALAREVEALSQGRPYIYKWLLLPLLILILAIPGSIASAVSASDY